jgi:hypothetical protein
LTAIQEFTNLTIELYFLLEVKMALKKRHRIILAALAELGGEATTRQIAGKVNLNVNGVSQSLGAISQVICLGGRGGETKWKIKI